jgi:2-polyprenyl-6-methoxyphenol hydroxylase-like FAD-dependent oxidoreductase
VKHPAKVMVAGANIGGMTAAEALRRAGLEVTVFERTAELREVGAGLLLAANAQKALGKLGLAEAVARLGTPASAAEIRSCAAHPMTPNLGQDACQAVEDAVVLARCLQEEGSHRRHPATLRTAAIRSDVDGGIHMSSWFSSVGLQVIRRAINGGKLGFFLSAKAASPIL